MTTTTNHRLAPAATSGGNLTLSWGLVVVPLKVYNGLADAKTHRSTFSPAGNPAGVQKIDKVTGEPIAQVIKKAEASDGTWVELTDEEIAEATASTGATKGAAEIEALIPLDVIGRDYIVEGIGHVRAAPTGTGKAKVPNPAAEKALLLLLTALGKRKKAALIRMAMRSAAKPAAILPDGTLVKLRFADEIRQAPPLPAHDLSAAEVEMACKLIDTMPDAEPVLVDETSAKIRAYVDEKAKALAAGKPLPTVEAAPDAPPVIDLMAAMQASLDAAAGAKPTKKTRKKAS